MSKPVLSFGLNLKKPASKPLPGKRKPAFGGRFGGGDDSDDEGQSSSSKAQPVSISEFGSLDDTPPAPETTKSRNGSKPKPSGGAPASAPQQPPSLRGKAAATSEFGDLSSALTARKHAEAAEQLDPSVYDYDGVYDSLKAQKQKKPADEEEEGGEGGGAARRPKYMDSLKAAAALRERDRLIAEEKRLAREREAEGDEFADKEKFVTEAYKKQQAENRRLEEEEKRREEEEARKNKGRGMTAFYKDMLERGDQQHAALVKAAEDHKAQEPKPGPDKQEEEDKTEADIAKEINEKGGHVIVNEDGQVVDKRQLLRGGLNVGAKKKAEAQKERERARHEDSLHDRERSTGVYAGGGKQAMRERQSRMMEAQLEANLKRAREEEEEERQKIEVATKSRKTEGEISSAKERFLARKRAAEEAKRNGTAGET